MQVMGVYAPVLPTVAGKVNQPLPAHRKGLACFHHRVRRLYSMLRKRLSPKKPGL